MATQHQGLIHGADETVVALLDVAVFMRAVGIGLAHSLSIDMAETFRPPLSDALLLSLFRRGQVDESWFDRYPNICLLNEKGRMKATERFWSRIEERCGELTFREAIHKQCLTLEREALGIGQFRAFAWRG